MIFALIAIGILICAYLLFFCENRRFVVRRTEIAHKKVVKPFTVVQISDLHDKRFGAGQEKLMQAIRDAKPDRIVITGDLFNRKNKNAYRNAFSLVNQCVRIAPVFFSEGNHECALGDAGEAYIKAIGDAGVHVLRDEFVDSGPVRFIGLKQYAEPEKLASMLSCEKLNVVLAHRPERFPLYAGTGADVILSGHAHGGQVRLFDIGLYAPEQGVFPKYTSGIYTIDKSLMYVSRGLGNTVIVPRVFNTPELDVLSFKPVDKKEQ